MDDGGSCDLVVEARTEVHDLLRLSAFCNKTGWGSGDKQLDPLKSVGRLASGRVGWVNLKMSWPGKCATGSDAGVRASAANGPRSLTKWTLEIYVLYKVFSQPYLIKAERNGHGFDRIVDTVMKSLSKTAWSLPKTAVSIHLPSRASSTATKGAAKGATTLNSNLGGKSFRTVSRNRLPLDPPSSDSDCLDRCL